MSNIHYNLNFEKLCTMLQLGDLVKTPESLSGGLLHRMYAVETTKGKYAIKALNPQIMIRPKAMQNLIDSEKISNIAAKSVPALPAKQFNGSSLQQIDNQYYLVFDWIEGRSLKPSEIRTVHSQKIGEIIAKIHMTDFSIINIEESKPNSIKLTDWNYYLQQGHQNNSVWVNLLNETIDQLYDWNAKANKATKRLVSNTVISHGDLDSKNVMWDNDSPILIDWEASGPINPM